METFAPAYFDYMSSAVSADVCSSDMSIIFMLLTFFKRPTLLAKVFGIYKLTFRKTDHESGHGKAKSTQMNLLVMENLFYDRRFSKAIRLLVRAGLRAYH